MQTKKFTVVDGIFSDRVLTLLEPYAKLLPTDKSSYNVWPDRSTRNKTLPECFTCDVLGKDRTEILHELFENPALPCYKQNWLKDADIAVQKMPEGALIDQHADRCLFSLTVFLSSVNGGYFVWWDDDGFMHTVEPVVNKAVFASYDDYVQGAPHKVNPVESGTRFTLQLFVFAKHNNTKRKDVVWETN